MTPWVNDAETTPRGLGHGTPDFLEDKAQIQTCPPPASSNGTAVPARTPAYQGYKFFKADPIPGEEATWTKVERMEMEASPSELYKKVQKRANKVSAAQQYQMLSDVLQAHVNQLIWEQRQLHPDGDWSCVYAKERQKASKARNASREDYEVVSMQVILMKRPLQRPLPVQTHPVQAKSYPRTPMGELVDLGPQFGAGLNHPKRVNSENIHQGSGHIAQLHAGLKLPTSHPYNWARNRQGKPSGTAVELEGVAPDLTARPSTSDGVLRNRNLDGSGKFAAMEEMRGHKRPRPEQDQLESYEDSETIKSDTQSDQGSFTPRTGSPSERSTGRVSPSIRCTCQDHCSPASYASLEDPDDQTPYAPAKYQHQDDAFSDLESKNSRCGSPCSSVDTVLPRSAPPNKRPRLSMLHNLPLGHPYIPPMNDADLRSRLLECEARIEQLQKTFYLQPRMVMRVPQRPYYGY